MAHDPQVLLYYAKLWSSSLVKSMPQVQKKLGKLIYGFYLGEYYFPIWKISHPKMGNSNDAE